MAKKSQRVFALVFATLFLLSSIGFSAWVIFEINKEKKNTGSDDASQKILEQLKAQQQEQQKNPNALKGTKLGDFTPIEKVNELQIVDITQGDGAEAPGGATVVVEYTGALAKDGTIFESSKDSGQPATLSLEAVIEGWKQGIPGMKVGGKRRLIIPAALAYGDQDKGTIPPNSDLVFDIELKEVK